jgi:hypothetical protein
VGGIKISHMSDLPKPLHLALTTTRGKRATHVVKPLAAEPVAKVLPVDTVTSSQLQAINDGLIGLGINDRDEGHGVTGDRPRDRFGEGSHGG